MFRSKKKRSEGGGGARKRKEIDAGSGDEAAAEAGTTNGANGDTQQAVRSKAGEDGDVDMIEPDGGGDNSNETAAASAENDGAGDEEDEDAMLARMRSRNAKRGKVKSAMTFSSKASSASSTRKSDSVASTSTTLGSLSFEDDQPQQSASSRKKQSKSKIRPNLLASNVVMSEEAGAEAATPANSYTFEMLDALRKEQKVLLRTALESEGDDDRQQPPGSSSERPQGSEESADFDMREVDGATIVMEQEQGEEMELPVPADSADDSEEFIPLHAKMMQSRKKRNRVTFGVHSSGPKLSKLTEVDEPTENSEDDDEAEADAQNRKWEEELMRRGGGHHAAQAIDPDRTGGYGAGASKRTYPTRKKVPNGSLADVLTKLQKSFDAATFENDRAERELARIDTEVLLIEESTKKQRQELLTSSEEFEYFQVIEDYVKGLSFCLREKVREIDASEKEIMAMRVGNIRGIRDEDATLANETVSKLVASGVIRDADVRGLRIYEAQSDARLSVESGDEAGGERFKRGFVDRTPAIQQDSTLDVFADAVDDMNSLQHVYGRFQEWRSKFPDVYKNCYCDIAAEKLYAPYVRAELLFWDPLSVSEPGTATRSKGWRFESFEWFQILRQHVRQPAPSTEERSSSGVNVDDGPTVAQIRDVVLAKALDAVAAYFDPFSALHTRSICLLLEEMAKYDGYTQQCAPVLTRLVAEVTTHFASESKLIPLVVVREKQAHDGGGATVSDFASYQLSRFNALLDNLLSFFVALPRDAAADSSQTLGFRCMMQVLHQLLAFLSHCQRVQKPLLVPQAVETVAQLMSSPYLQQLLASSSQEQELQHVLALFAPFVAI